MKGVFFHTERFHKWRDTFGDNYELRPMIRKDLYRNCVVHDFLNFAFKGAEFSLLNDPSSNLSLSLEDLSMLREFHLMNKGQKGYDKERSAFGWHFARILTNMPRKQHTKPSLHKSLAKDVINTYQADAAQLDKDFFQGTPLTDSLLASEAKAVNKAQSIEAADYFKDDDLRTMQVWAQLLSILVQDNPEEVSRILRAHQLHKLKGSSLKPL